MVIFGKGIQGVTISFDHSKISAYGIPEIARAPIVIDYTDTVKTVQFVDNEKSTCFEHIYYGSQSGNPKGHPGYRGQGMPPRPHPQTLTAELGQMLSDQHCVVPTCVSALSLP